MAKPLIISLTSIPPRFDKLGPVLDGLLRQKAKIDEIRLYLPRSYRRFPEYDGHLPDVPAGIRIIRPNEDLGPASKVLFAADDLRNTDCNLIYCDDDRIYHDRWFSQMLDARAGHERTCIVTSYLLLERLGFKVATPRLPRVRISQANPRRLAALVRRKIKQIVTGQSDKKPPANRRVSRAGYVDIAEGCGAVLVSPDFFDAEAFEIPPVLWAVDDIWLSGQMERRGIPIWCPKGFPTAPLADASRESALYDAVIDGARRGEANVACVRYMQKNYGIWR